VFTWGHQQEVYAGSVGWKEVVGTGEPSRWTLMLTNGQPDGRLSGGDDLGKLDGLMQDWRFYCMWL
jgi:hypothetical protein